MSYEHIVVEWRSAHVAEVRMNRPEKRNAMNMKLWQEVGHVFGVYLQHHPKCRAILLTGAGSVFSAGIDLSSSFVSNLQNDDGEDDGVEWDGAHSAAKILRDGGAWQQAWLAINRCNKPVIACIQRGCFGAALEMIAYTDIRFCTADTVFQAPEVDIGLAADIGGNQMLPKIIGNDSLLREIMITGRKVSADEALAVGLVSRTFATHSGMMAEAYAMAETIAAKSPLAVMGVKNMLNYTRDHSVEDALRFGLTWNAGMLQTQDVQIAGAAFVTKQKPTFPDAPQLLRPSKL
eukprot:gene7022-7384_t